MGKKAVYNNKGLAVYITGEDFIELLERTNGSVKVHIGKAETKKSFLWITLSVEALADLVNAFTLERDAIDDARREHLSGFGQHARIIQNRNRS